MTPEELFEAFDSGDLEPVAEEIRAGRVRVTPYGTGVLVSLVPLGPRAEFGRALAALRGEVTILALSQELEVSQSSMYRMLAGQVLPSWPVVRDYVRFLGEDPEVYRGAYLEAKRDRATSTGQRVRDR